MLQAILNGLLSTFREQIAGSIWSLTSLCILTICFYIFWRQWTFFFYPLFNPQKPAEVPYWIPFLGHSLAMFGDTASLIRQSVNHFQRSYVPFSIQVLGQRLYVVSSPEDVATVYKNPAIFSWDEYMDLLLKAFGLTPEARRLSWWKPSPGEMNDPVGKILNPQHKCLVHVVEDIYKTQLLPGEQLDLIMQSVVGKINFSLSWEQLHGPFILQSQPTSRRLSVKLLCRILLTDATTRTMFGDLIFRYEPRVIEYLMVLNDYSWAYIFEYPTIFTPKLNEARKALTEALRSYLRTPECQRVGEVWSIRRIIQSQEYFGIDESSRIAMLLMVWWAAHSNTVNASFWLLSYVIYDRSLLQALREETRPAFQNSTMDVDYLRTHCPLLTSSYYEMLRQVNGAMSIRKVSQDVHLSGKLLKAGNAVLIPYRELHFNENVWGDSSREFCADRFLRQPKLASHSAYRPFGGGVSYCPGRHLAMAEVCGFVATVIQRFEIELPPTAEGNMQSFPEIDRLRPSTGITSSMEGSDLFVDVKPRKEEEWV
ncbi:cytochrome P450 [Delitschia confertaspora ATCC 74209]|uniref:Cytochrome P450 n=1 Tax=Delitschia confertaspora ATCC 74209 TaxID=1513339 RepID=A0A9P4JMZ0_9PLEO|nr:cytochrome P450 [Delitschia confertaspora ATCC 74209]